MTLFHTDVLITMQQALINQHTKGEISDLELAKQLEPLNAELMKRIAEQNETIAVQEEEIKKGLTQAKIEAREIATAIEEYSENYKQLVNDYEAFLLHKGLNDEYEEWLFKQYEQRIREGSD